MVGARRVRLMLVLDPLWQSGPRVADARRLLDEGVLLGADRPSLGFVELRVASQLLQGLSQDLRVVDGWWRLRVEDHRLVRQGVVVVHIAVPLPVARASRGLHGEEGSVWHLCHAPGLVRHARGVEHLRARVLGVGRLVPWVIIGVVRQRLPRPSRLPPTLPQPSHRPQDHQRGEGHRRRRVRCTGRGAAPEKAR